MLAGQNRPSPRKLSQVFMKGIDGLPSAKNKTAMLAFFGKFIKLNIICIDVHKILTDLQNKRYNID